jgi:methylenetetrahydrofolate dehydrogenase (NADP+)/methenyltetrahydrofolate cyclohydrolase
MDSELILKPDTMTEDELLTLIDELNNDSSVTGILVQLPLPKHIDSTKVIHAIKPIKDVDGFHPENIGNFMIGGDALMSCTPAGIITMLESIDVKLEGAHAVVVGRSNIVGNPVSQMLLSKNCTVTVCHSRTKDLGAITRQADILVAAVGRAKMITEDMVKDGAVVIDVGVNRVDGKLVGDVDFETIKEKASFITPVPGGVGPMTITTLLTNTLKAAKLQNK